MGWNGVTPSESSLLFGGEQREWRFYFVHSFHVECERSNDVDGVTEYGEPFSSAFAKENIFGVQYHPEKSHRYGLELFNNFLENA